MVDHHLCEGSLVVVQEGLAVLWRKVFPNNMDKTSLLLTNNLGGTDANQQLSVSNNSNFIFCYLVFVINFLLIRLNVQRHLLRNTH